MREREWEWLMAQIANAVGASSVALVFGCGGNVTGESDESSAGGAQSEPSAGGQGGSTNAGGSSAGGGSSLGGASTGGRNALGGAGGVTMPFPQTGGAPPRDPGTTFTENEAGIRTYAIPFESPPCEDYPVTRRERPTAELVA
jgi:hypothetical protein